MLNRFHKMDTRKKIFLVGSVIFTMYVIIMNIYLYINDQISSELSYWMISANISLTYSIYLYFRLMDCESRQT